MQTRRAQAAAGPGKCAPGTGGCIGAKGVAADFADRLVQVAQLVTINAALRCQIVEGCAQNMFDQAVNLKDIFRLTMMLRDLP